MTDIWTEENTHPIQSQTLFVWPACSLTWQGRTSTFARHRVAIGKDPSNDLVLPHATVSRFHAEVVKTGSGYLLRDLGSTNGTHVGKVRINEAWLEPGSVIQFGGVSLVFSATSQTHQVGQSQRRQLGGLVGCSPPMRRVFDIAERISSTDATVLILGETGTGKGLLAETIHRQSSRGDRPFVPVDCAAIPAALMESELFGHERGAFTGAISVRKGLLEQAHLGTVFLDEVGELPLDLQPKLLRFLDSFSVRRVGGGHAIPLDVRVIAATHRNLEEEVERGRFRRDLFYRLNVVPLVLPSLRDRKEDIPVMVEHFLEEAKFNRTTDGARRVLGLSPAVMSSLLAWSFPGNVRELVHLLEREISLCSTPVIENLSLPLGREHTLSAEPAAIDQNQRGMSDQFTRFHEAKEAALSEFHRTYLGELMRRSRGNLSLASRMAGVDRKHLRQLLRTIPADSECTTDGETGNGSSPTQQNMDRLD